MGSSENREAPGLSRGSVTEETYAYAAFKTCGCMVGAAVDNPEHARDVAREVGKWLRAGFRVERVTCEAVRQGCWRCPHDAEEGKSDGG